MNKKVFILGGGPAGLAVADGLIDAGISFTLLEYGASLGGLARTVQWADYGSHDLGPHKIFTLNQALLRRIRAYTPRTVANATEEESYFYERLVSALSTVSFCFDQCIRSKGVSSYAL